MKSEGEVLITPCGLAKPASNMPYPFSVTGTFTGKYNVFVKKSILEPFLK